MGQFWTPIDTEAVQLSDGNVALSFRAAARAAFSCGRRSKHRSPSRLHLNELASHLKALFSRELS